MSRIETYALTAVGKQEVLVATIFCRDISGNCNTLKVVKISVTAGTARHGIASRCSMQQQAGIRRDILHILEEQEIVNYL